MMNVFFLFVFCSLILSRSS